MVKSSSAAPLRSSWLSRLSASITGFRTALPSMGITRFQSTSSAMVAGILARNMSERSFGGRIWERTVEFISSTRLAKDHLKKMRWFQGRILMQQPEECKKILFTFTQ